MFELAHGYARNDMSAFVELQQKEFAAAEKGFTAVKHQREVGTGYFDEITQVVTGGKASTTALHGSTEDEQFFDSQKKPKLAAASPMRGGGADRFQYDLVVEASDGRHELAMSEDTIPTELRPLIDRDKAEIVEIEPIWTTGGAGDESPDGLALRRELSIYLERALTALPEDQRMVVLLVDVQGLDYHEVAETLGIALGTVKSRLSRARARIRQALADDAPARELFERYLRLEEDDEGDRAATPMTPTTEPDDD
jgi:RNA polymerase sigma factor (sigma-70 family)